MDDRFAIIAAVALVGFLAFVVGFELGKRGPAPAEAIPETTRTQLAKDADQQVGRIIGMLAAEEWAKHQMPSRAEADLTPEKRQQALTLWALIRWTQAEVQRIDNAMRLQRGELPPRSQRSPTRTP